MEKLFSLKQQGICHGGNLSEFAKRYGKKENEIIDFSSNVNPLPLPASLVRTYREGIHELVRYPEPYSESFSAQVANFFSVPLERVAVGNGSMALLAGAIRILAPSSALLVEPCFGEYRRLLELQGTDILSATLSAEEDFKFPFPAILEALEEIELLVLGHPNNPTGTALLREEIEQLLGEARRKNVFVIVDEAFSDWVPEISVIQNAGHLDGFLVVRSMTKFFALAGIRSGFAIGPETLIDNMKKQEGPWGCNRLSQKLSAAALADISFQEESRRWLRDERVWLYETLQKFGMFRTIPSLANFLLVQSEKSLDGFFDFLGSRGIYVRSLQDFSGLDDSYFRVAIRTRRDNEYLIRVINEWIKKCS